MPRKTVHSWTSARPAGRPANQPCPSAGPRAPRRYLNPLKSAYMFGQRRPGKQKKELTRTRRGGRAAAVNVSHLFFCRRESVTSQQNRCGLVTPRGCSRPAGPSGPRGVFTARLLWRMIRLDTLSTELVLLQQHILWR